MSTPCVFCGGPVNPHDVGVRKEVTGWVGGLHKDAMTMRQDTGRFAHDACVQRERKGLTDQPDMFEEKPTPVSTVEIEHVDFDALMEQ